MTRNQGKGKERDTGRQGWWLLAWAEEAARPVFKSWL